ncbi:hypothetical protein F8388_009820 [Cannabis sativa]|uniref:Uncharacterized protein n=1 Tax=Cannabis sativa TaxID=3483 RepID=A0A7J6H392_CANSA|nr:hypothetical protein F8388_009820 [Cannabis sativa]
MAEAVGGYYAMCSNCDVSKSIKNVIKILYGGYPISWKKNTTIKVQHILQLDRDHYKITNYNKLVVMNGQQIT